jgi:hypothetical protein
MPIKYMMVLIGNWRLILGKALFTKKEEATISQKI